MNNHDHLIMFANCLLLLFVVGIPVYAYCIKKVSVYDSFVDGAKEGFQLVIRLVPFFVGMLVAIGMLRASGAIDLFGHLFASFFSKIGVSPDLLPLILLRPLSASASIGTMADIIHTHGGNSPISQMAATIMSSSETTFYVVAVYFGAVNIKKTRHAIPAGLIADFAAVVAAVWICRFIFG